VGQFPTILVVAALGAALLTISGVI